MNTYTVELTERAELDIDDIFLRYNRNAPNQVDRWQAGFTKSLASLSSLPNRCPIARDDARYQGITVRQLLFGKYRILFHVVEPAEGETEGSVRVIRVVHGSRASEQEDGDDDQVSRKMGMTIKPEYSHLPTVMPAERLRLVREASQRMRGTDKVTPLRTAGPLLV